jgi:hypothetical protein
VLYIDAELDDEEFRRRAYAVARGLGLQRPPKGLYYLRLSGSLGHERTKQELSAAVKQCGSQLVVLDSITVAASGSDVREADVATALMRFLDTLGTVLAVDHIAKPAQGSSQSDYRPFGSVFKYNLGRSVLQVIKAHGGALLVCQTKSNFGPKAKPVGVAVEFGDRTVKFESVAEGDKRLAGIEIHLPAIDRVAAALAECGPVDAEELAEHLDMKTKTVRNYLSTLRHLGRAARIGSGKWEVPKSHVSRERESGRLGRHSVKRRKAVGRDRR